MHSYATNQDQQYKEEMEAHLRTIANQTPLASIANGFAKYARRQEVTRFLARYEMFKMVQDIQGSIVECGVFAGQGLFSWAQMSAILSPVGDAFRHIYGFDTFEGFPGMHAKDLKSSTELGWKVGDLKCDSYADLLRCIELFDMNRFLPQFSKMSLIKGDFMQTAETFLEKNPHVLVSLLYLDFDLYEPTKKGLEIFLPRMSKGAVIAFDEINHPLWPGETLALLESMNIRDVKIQKFPFEINMSYIVL